MFAVDGKGNPTSYIHIDESQIDVMLETIKVLETMPTSQTKDMNGWVSVKNVHMKLKKSYPLLACNTVQHSLALLAGALFIDIKAEENTYETMPIKKIHLNQPMNHPKLNLDLAHTKIPRYLKGTRYVRLALNP